MPKIVRSTYIPKKRIRRPGRHKKKVNKRDKVKTHWA